MADVLELINAREQQRPDEPAFITASDGHTLTWRAVARNADRMRRLAAERRLPAPPCGQRCC